MSHYGTVLVGVDFLPGSNAAMRQSMRMRQWSRATIHAEHIVVPPIVIDSMDGFGSLVAGVEEELVALGRDRWKELAARTPGIEGVHFGITIDSIVGGLTRRAREQEAGLLVLGNREEGIGIGVGPTAKGCVRRAACDVLLVQGYHDKAYSTVVACVDFSLTSRRAYLAAAQIALRDNARLIVVHAYRSPWKDPKVSKARLQDVQESTFNDALLARLKSFCEAEPHEANVVKPKYELVEKRGLGYGLGQYALSISADLVVLGKRGRTNMRDVFLGSTAEQILQEVACSALVVHPI